MKNSIQSFSTFIIIAFLLTSCYTKLALTSSVESSEDNLYPVSVEYTSVNITPPPSDAFLPVVSPIQQRPFKQGGSIQTQNGGSKRVPINGKDRPRKSKTAYNKNLESQSKHTAKKDSKKRIM